MATRKRRRLVITVCPREPGVVRLPVCAGQRPSRLDALGIIASLRGLVAERRLARLVEIREGCAGGCTRPGPNVSVAFFPVHRRDHPADHVAVAWKTYVYSLPTLACLAQILTDNLPHPRPTRTTPST
jgi:hypothetical protein